MNYSFSISGAVTPVIKEFTVEKEAKISAGTIVFIDENGVVNGDGNGKILGVAAEEHTGEKDLLNERANGDRIRVDITLGGVYKMPCPVFEASEDADGTALICENAKVDENCKGYLVLIFKGEDSVNGDAIGTRRRISSVAVNDSKAVFTLDEGEKICKGDRYAFVPAAGFIGGVDESFGGFCAVKTEGKPELYVVCSNATALTVEAVIGSKLFN